MTDFERKLLQEFEQHKKDNAKALADFRAEMHTEINSKFDEIIKMIKPVADAFDFKTKLGTASMTVVVNVAKVLGAILALSGVVSVIYKFYMMNHVK